MCNGNGYQVQHTTTVERVGPVWLPGIDAVNNGRQEYTGHWLDLYRRTNTKFAKVAVFNVWLPPITDI